MIFSFCADSNINLNDTKSKTFIETELASTLVKYKFPIISILYL